MPEVQAVEVCGFLWGHLVNDVRNLSTSLERSEDEVILAIHLVLSDIVDRATTSKSHQQYIEHSLYMHAYDKCFIVLCL